MRPTVCCLLLCACFSPVSEVEPDLAVAPPPLPPPASPQPLADGGRASTPPRCDATTCHGCCAADGSCVGYGEQSAAACGQGGNRCDACPGVTRCTAGACLGNGGCSTDCIGCCSGNTCIALTAQSETSCGQRGDTCERCFGGALCTAGTCSGR